MNQALHTISKVARLYVPGKEGGRGLISVAQCAEMETRSLRGYLAESQECIPKAVWRRK